MDIKVKKLRDLPYPNYHVFKLWLTTVCFSVKMFYCMYAKSNVRTFFTCYVHEIPNKLREVPRP